MMNRVFLMWEQASEPAVLPAREENVYYSIMVNPLDTDALEKIYAAPPPADFALTLIITAPLTLVSLRSLSSFLFMPSYLRLEYRPVINLTGNSAELIREGSSALSDYLSGQGFSDPLLQVIAPEAYFHSIEAVGIHYEKLLQSDPCYDQLIFFHATSPGIMASVLSSLQEAERAHIRQDLRLWNLLLAHQRLQNEQYSLRRELAATAAELQYQRQYVDILRSDHAAKEIQDYYTKEYEILPLWYKRFGHLLKVLTGKRTFSSLFRNDLKKYKV